MEASWITGQQSEPEPWDCDLKAGPQPGSPVSRGPRPDSLSPSPETVIWGLGLSLAALPPEEQLQLQSEPQPWDSDLRAGWEPRQDGF